MLYAHEIFHKTLVENENSVDVWVQVQIEKLQGNQDAYFSIRARRKDKWDSGGFCADYETVRKYFPELERYIRWHLTGVKTGPVHYIANALYWAGHSGHCDGFTNSPPNEGHLKNTIVYGAVPEDNEVNPIKLTADELKEWLIERFESLMDAFDEDMRRLFGNGVFQDKGE